MKIFLCILFFKDYEDINKGIVNSLMYEKQAKHFTKINQIDCAIKYLTIGKGSKSVNIYLIFFCIPPAHFMDPDNKNILSDLARSFLGIGDSKEALRCAESVLKKVSYWFVVLTRLDR